MQPLTSEQVKAVIDIITQGFVDARATIEKTLSHHSEDFQMKFISNEEIGKRINASRGKNVELLPPAPNGFAYVVHAHTHEGIFYKVVKA